MCKVVEGMSVAEALFAEYGEQVTSKQGEITAKGNAYLKDAWPNLDYVKSATIVGAGGSPTPAPSTPASEGSGSAMYVVGALLVLGIGVLLVTGRGEPAPAHPPAAPAKGPARSAKKPGAERGKKAGPSRAKPSATKAGPAKPSAE